MADIQFSEWPGVWERQIIRRCRYPLFFVRLPTPTISELEQAQKLDQQELAELESDLAMLVGECTSISSETNIEHVSRIKSDLDLCYDTACGLGAALKEQKEALTMLNEVITTAIRRALRDDDEYGRLLLIKQESVRMRHLTRLNYPIVCDLLRTDCPIPTADLAASMLAETDEAFTVALEILDDNKRQSLNDGIATIATRLHAQSEKLGIDRKQMLLQKILSSGSTQPDTTHTSSPTTESSESPNPVEPETG